MTRLNKSNHLFLGELFLRHNQQQANHLLMNRTLRHLEGEMRFALIKAVGFLALAFLVLLRGDFLCLISHHLPYLDLVH